MLTVSKVIAPHTYTHDKNITSTAYPGQEVKMHSWLTFGSINGIKIETMPLMGKKIGLIETMPSMGKKIGLILSRYLLQEGEKCFYDYVMLF